MIMIWTLALVSLTSSEKTGVKFGISNGSINEGKTALLTQLIDETQGKTILDSVSFTGSPFSFNFTLSDAIVEKISGNIAGSELKFEEENRMTLIMSDFTGALAWSMSLTSSIFADSAEAFLEIEGVDLNAGLYIYVKKGHPVMEIETLEVDISKFQFSIKGSKFSGIVNTVFQLFNRKIKSKIEEQLSTSLKDKLNDVLYNIFTTNPLVRRVNDMIGVNYTLTENVQITQDFIEISSAGEFFLLGSSDKPSLPDPLPLPSFDSSFGGIQTASSDYMINTYYFTAFKAGLLQVTIDSQEFPALSLNTKNLEAYFPGIEEKFGKDKECELVCAVVEQAPIVSIVPDGIGKVQGEFSASCDLNVDDAGTAAQFIAAFEFEGEPYLDLWTLKGRLMSMAAKNLQETKNFTGQPANIEKLEEFVNDFIQEQTDFFEALVFGEGIPLPQNGSDNFKGFNLKVGDGYVLAATNPSYSLS